MILDIPIERLRKGETLITVDPETGQGIVIHSGDKRFKIINLLNE